MERSWREGDPWAGQISFPGGHREGQDENLGETARREAYEEVGIELPLPFGRLQDVKTAAGPGAWVTPFVFHVAGSPPLRLDRAEVQQALWIPLGWFLDPRSAAAHRLEREGRARVFPAVRYREHLVWGLTYRTLEILFGVLGHDLPRLADDGGPEPIHAPRE